MWISEDDRVGWILTLSATATCIAGSLVIFSDSAWNSIFKRHQFSLAGSKQVLTASLGLSSGVLLFTSLYKLLPSAHQYFQNSPQLDGDGRAINAALIGTYVSGVVVCAVFNTVLHAFTSKSIVHCSDHGGDGGDPFEAAAGAHSSPMQENGRPHGQSHGHGHGHANGNGHSHSHATESTPLIETVDTTIVAGQAQVVGSRRLKSSRSLIDFVAGSVNKRLSGKCMGYTSIEDCACLIKMQNDACVQSSEGIIAPEEVVHHHHRVETELGLDYGAFDSSYDDQEAESQSTRHGNESGNNDHHHHHILTQYSHLFSIGIQTAMAISIHKIPEGFLTFASNHADRQLGINVFIALAIHNFSEGFSVAFPLYLALKSRAKAFLIAALLTGISQPMGALFAMLLFKRKIDERQTNLLFGIIVAVTSGFMTLIGMQMYGTSIYYGGQQWAVLTWFMIGITLIGLTTILMP